MKDDWKELVQYYTRQGAPNDQTALVSLLRELQQLCGGGLPTWEMGELAMALGVKESFILAVIRRIPSLRLSDNHLLELCAGPNCGRHRQLADLAEKLCGQTGVMLKFVPCMRLCGKGPNVKYDGKLYHGADEALLYRLLREGPGCQLKN